MWCDHPSSTTCFTTVSRQLSPEGTPQYAAGKGRFAPRAEGRAPSSFSGAVTGGPMLRSSRCLFAERAAGSTGAAMLRYPSVTRCMCRMNSRQPRICRTKPSALASGIRPFAAASTTSSTTRLGSRRLILMNADIFEWNRSGSAVCIASSYGPNSGRRFSRLHAQASFTSARLIGMSQLASRPKLPENSRSTSSTASSVIASGVNLRRGGTPGLPR